ncbi:MAG: malonyl-CoA decarboxylase [Alphaproteobacteria bacterium]
MSETTVTVGLFDRTRTVLRRALADVMEVAGVRRNGALRPDLPEDDLERLRQKIDVCLAARGGEVTARANAAELARTYLDLNREGRLRFFGLLAESYGVDRADLDGAIAAVPATADRPSLDRAIQRLREILEPPRLQLFKKFNGLENGIKFLVDLRADLLDLTAEAPALRPVERELRDLMASWFDVGFLALRRIDWQSPASLLEKLIAYEAVHEIRSWDDLKNRLESDRRCYAFMHPSLPDEPLIFVEVALVHGIAGSIQTLLDERAPTGDPEEADTAIFYSISNAQRGLAGVSFGSFLIKQVVDDLSHDFPRLRTFSTLSPIPGFRAWLAEREAAGETLLEPAEANAIAEATTGDDGEAADVVALGPLLDRADWPRDPLLAGALQAPLTRLCADYLLNARRGEKRARDPVAHFHISNGARVERLNWLGDRSPRGMKQSAGLMVNYLYRLDQIAENHEAYADSGEVAASSAVRNLL